MPWYLLIGPGVALIGIVAVVFVMRHKAVQTRSMYSSRRSQFERKVKAARQRTLTPHGKEQPPEVTPASAPETAVYVPPRPAALPSQAWDVGVTPTPAPAPLAYPTPSSPSVPVEPAAPPPAEPVWTPAPAEPWTPLPAQAAPAEPAAPPMEPATPAPMAPAASGGGGAAWSIVGESKEGSEDEPVTARKGKRKDRQAATGAGWELASGEAPGGEAEDEVKAPSAAMAIAQYAVIVFGLIAVLIGVVLMIANQKVT